jgi:hypothetical protein
LGEFALFLPDPLAASEPNSVTLQTEASRSSETSGQTHYTTWCKNTEDQYVTVPTELPRLRSAEFKSQIASCMLYTQQIILVKNSAVKTCLPASYPMATGGFCMELKEATAIYILLLTSLSY